MFEWNGERYVQKSGSLVTPGQSLTGETFEPKNTIPGLLIDWLTLRVPVSILGPALSQRIEACLGLVVCTDSEGVVKWEKRQLDIDKLRSDSDGLFWGAQSNGRDSFLVIAASPASVTQATNVFGSLDIRESASVLRRVAMKSLEAYLPEVEFWQCRRIDITGNYALPDARSVKQALRQLLNTDGVRRKASSTKRGGDSVYWSPTSDLTKGKAYHKGEQLRVLIRRGKLVEGSSITARQLAAADRLLRLEHTRGARWFRRFEEAGGKWLALCEKKLAALFVEFFGPLVGGLEVKDMGTENIKELIVQKAVVSASAAERAFSTYLNIKAYGFETTRLGMKKATWHRHLKMLRQAGFSDAQLCAGNVVPFQAVKVLLAVPVASWSELQAA